MTNTKPYICVQVIKKEKLLSNAILHSQKSKFRGKDLGTIILNKEKQLDWKELRKNSNIKESIKSNTRETKREESKDNREDKEVKPHHHKIKTLTMIRNKKMSLNNRLGQKNKPNFLNSN